MSQPPPIPHGKLALQTLRRMIADRSPLRGMEILHRELGDVFRLPLPGFNPVMLVGPETARFVHVTGSQKLLWRAEGDPVTRLLRRGLLVEDYQAHDDLRRQLDPSLRRQRLDDYAAAFVRRTDQITQAWGSGHVLDMLVEMRRIALLILVDTLLGEDFTPDLDRLWIAILRVLRFISPGPWIVWPQMPRMGYQRAKQTVDAYLYDVISTKRSTPAATDDMISRLIAAGLDDESIRDQALTMLIAGHDTSTSLLAWTLHLLGSHPTVAAKARSEVDRALGDQSPSIGHIKDLGFLGQVIDECLRLYPPIHLSNRIAAEDLAVNGYRIAAGTRVMHSIYLTHRDPRHWPDPHRFDPDRFSPPNSSSRPHYTYLPFGGGRRNCIGSAFARAEAHIVLARLLQRFDFAPIRQRVRPHMGATLEPRPGVFMRVRLRSTPTIRPHSVGDSVQA